jgi:hypothetical protein
MYLHAGMLTRQHHSTRKLRPKKGANMRASFWVMTRREIMFPNLNASHTSLTKPFATALGFVHENAR